MSYVQKTLSADERLLTIGQVHWMSYVPAALLIFLGTFLLALAVGGQFPMLPLLNVLAVITLLIGGIGLLVTIVNNLTTEFAVTNKRIIVKRGWIARKTEEQRLEKVDSISVDQSILGRLFSYGTVTVRGSGVSLTPVKGVSEALQFRAAAQQAIEGGR